MSRIPMDQYFTPHAAITRRLLTRHGWTTGVALEPCAGAGAISDVMKEAGLEVITGDIDPMMDPDILWNFPVAAKMGACPEVDFIISNPPFNLANEIVKVALASCPNVAMLLRLSWIEPTAGRRQIWTLMPPTHVHPLHPRPCFTGDGKTDSSTCAWFVWAPPVRGTRLEPFTDWHLDAQGVLHYDIDT